MPDDGLYIFEIEAGFNELEEDWRLEEPHLERAAHRGGHELAHFWPSGVVRSERPPYAIVERVILLADREEAQLYHLSPGCRG